MIAVKVKTGMFTQWHPVKMRQKKSYSVWVGGDSGLTKVVVSGDLMIEDTVGDLLQTQAPVLSALQSPGPRRNTKIW